ncbi:MAG: hypothetical protein ACRDQZ_14225, partial [Mycobacteriales bacterium]
MNKENCRAQRLMLGPFAWGHGSEMADYAAFARERGTNETPIGWLAALLVSVIIISTGWRCQRSRQKGIANCS